jgi:hypothetical protein
MAESRPGLRFFTLEEANELLPKVRTNLKLLREVRRRIVAKQALVDIEELTATPSRVDRERQDQLLREIEQDVHSFHKTLEAFQALGCELKDLERGLVDFYSMRDNDVVFLCWTDGEDSIQWWHPLDSGVKGRKPLDR